MDSVMDVFLERWTVYMQAAGYLVFTTARRADCIAACHSLTNHIVRHLDAGYLPTFERLAGNSDNWAQDLVASGLRHMRRGITGTMYLGCFKTFIHALEDAVHALRSVFSTTRAFFCVCTGPLLKKYGWKSA